MTGIHIAAMAGEVTVQKLSAAWNPSDIDGYSAGTASFNVGSGQAYVSSSTYGLNANQFSYSVSRVSGSSKLSAQLLTAATDTEPPRYRFNANNFAVGETQGATFRVTVSAENFESGEGFITVRATRQG